MKIYVIGASGFLGKHLSEWFGKCGVVQNAPSYHNINSNAEKWQNDVLEEMRKFSPDLVLIPGASQLTGDDSNAISSLIASNCVLPCLVAQTLIESLPCARLVVFGSSWQFSDSDSYRPFNLYAASKQAGQDMLTHYALRGLKILQLMMFDTYSENDTRQKLLTLLREAADHGAEISTTLGEQEIDLVHIDDVCQGVECAVHELQYWDASQGILVRGLGSGKPILVKELILRVNKKSKKNIQAKIGGRTYRPREVMRVWRNYVRPANWTAHRIEFQDKFGFDNKNTK